MWNPRLSFPSVVAAALTFTGLSRAQSPAPAGPGLAPPPAIDVQPPPAPPNQTEAELSRADRQDAGRGLEFVWLNVEGAVEHIGLHTFHENKLVDSDTLKSVQTGPVFGAGAGLRLIFLTAGLRFRLASFSAWQLWTLNGEFGWRVPLGALEPYFTLGGGYASLGGFDSSRLSEAGIASGGISAHGFNVRGGAGVDYYLGRTLSIGANLNGEFLFLSRSKATSSETASNPTLAALYSQKGSGIGGGVTLSAVFGLHF